MENIQKASIGSIIQYNTKNENYWSNQNAKIGSIYTQNFTNLEDDDDDDIIEPDRDYEDNSEPDNDTEREEKEHPHKYITPQVEDAKKEEMFYEYTDNTEVLKEQNTPINEVENTTPIDDNKGEMFHE